MPRKRERLSARRILQVAAEEYEAALELREAVDATRPTFRHELEFESIAAFASARVEAAKRGYVRCLLRAGYFKEP